MKKLLIALTIAATMPARAEQASCEQIGELAQTVMQKRQEGVTMSALMAVASSNQIAKLMVINAYDKPQYNSAEYREREVIKFRNNYEAACYKQHNK